MAKGKLSDFTFRVTGNKKGGSRKLDPVANLNKNLATRKRGDIPKSTMGQIGSGLPRRGRVSRATAKTLPALGSNLRGRSP
jgi:hypothetical protein